jgi:hypothetical protein
MRRFAPGAHAGEGDGGYPEAQSIRPPSVCPRDLSGVSFPLGAIRPDSFREANQTGIRLEAITRAR